VKEVRKLAGQTMIYGLGTIIPRFLHYAVLTPFYTRIFTNTRDYGIVTELYAWMVILLVILTYGMETGFFRFVQVKENTEKVFSTALISLLVTSLLFVILINVFISPVSQLMNYKNNQDYIRLFAWIVAIDAFTAIPFAKLRQENKALLFSTIKLANVFITLIVVIFLLKIAPGLYDRGNGLLRGIYDPQYKVGYIFVANLISSSATLIMLLPVILKMRLIFDRVLWKRMISYSYPLLLAGLSGSINDAIDKILLRRMAVGDEGLSIVGKYGAAYKIAVLMALFIQMFRFAAEPFFFERAKYSDAKETYAYVMKYFVIIMLAVYLGINLYISGIQYIIGRNYREAIIVVPIVSMGYLLYGIYINHSIWYKLNDLTRYATYITVIGAVVTLIVNLLFIPKYGYLASAWAHVVSYGSMIILSFLFSFKHYRVNYNMIKLLPYFLIAVFMVIFGLFFDYKNLVSELCINTIFIIGFIAFAQYKDKLLSVFLIR
jgi:O-antigen/teichoic acid export membrane protein